MATKIKNLPLLQKLEPGAWLNADFVLPLFVESFHAWLREYVAGQPQEEFRSLSGETRLHLRGTEYESSGRVGVGAYWSRLGKLVETRDTIAFVFTWKTGDGKYRVSANADPIVLEYFVRMLAAISRQWPEALPGISEYLARLKFLASGLQVEEPGRRGRKSQFSEEERDKVVQKWEARDKERDARTIDVFLSAEFGDKDSDSMVPAPIVSPSTFYAWRRDWLGRQAKKSNSKPQN